MKENQKEAVFEAIEKFQQTQNVEYYNTIYNLTYPEVRARIVSFTNVKGQNDKLSATDDILSKVMIKVWNNLNMISESKAFFKWLNVTIEHTCLDEWNMAKNQKEVFVSSFTSNDEDGDRNIDYVFERYDANEEFNVINNEERKDIVRNALSQLDASTADIINKFYFEDLSTKDISYLLDMKEGTVRSKLSRGRIELAEQMEQEAKKRGFKLYNLSFFGMFLFLHDKTVQTEIAAILGTTGVSGKGSNAKGKAAATSKSTAATASKAAASTAAKTAAASSAAKATAAASTAAATATAGGAKAAAAAVISHKVIGGAVAAALVVGGGIGAKTVVEKVQNSRNDQTVVENESETTPAASLEATEKVVLDNVKIVKRGLEIEDAKSYLLTNIALEYYYSANINEDDPDPYDTGKSPNCIEIIKNGKHGVYDYDGNELLAPEYETLEYLSLDNTVAVLDSWTYYDVSDDFSTLTQIDSYGIGGDNGRTYVSNGIVVNSYAGTITPGTDFAETETLVELENGGTAVVSPYAEVISEMAAYSSYETGFANGYLFLSDTECEYDINTNEIMHGSLALFNGLTGEQITDFEFEDAGYIWNGYAPVKKDGKWGFVDETGKLVVDYIFEDASSLYDNKAYVKYNGEWMIINVVESLQNGEINTETMDASLA